MRLILQIVAFARPEKRRTNSYKNYAICLTCSDKSRRQLGGCSVAKCLEFHLNWRKLLPKSPSYFEFFHQKHSVIPGPRESTLHNPDDLQAPTTLSRFCLSCCVCCSIDVEGKEEFHLPVGRLRDMMHVGKPHKRSLLSSQATKRGGGLRARSLRKKTFF